MINCHNHTAAYSDDNKDNKRPSIIVVLQSRGCFMHFYIFGFGCWVSNKPKRFLTVILWREYLSSGENRAGCADCVGLPVGEVF